jgi:acyl-CoA synthetase (NDP forming)
MTNVDEMNKLAEAGELKQLERMKEMRGKYGKPIIFCAMGVDIVKQGEVYKWLEGNYLVPYPTPERGAKALSRLVEYSEYLGMSR